jgi:hypothetical protein
MPTFLCRHGNWYPKTDLPRVPEDTRVTFYTQNAKTLWIQEAVKILNGTTQFNDSCRRSKDRGQYPGESDYIASVGGRPTDVQKSTFRGFMPAGWSVPKPGS